MVDSNAEMVTRFRFVREDVVDTGSAFGGWNGDTLPLLWLLRLCTEMVVLLVVVVAAVD